jgi:hypothetical protein
MASCLIINSFSPFKYFTHSCHPLYLSHRPYFDTLHLYHFVAMKLAVMFYENGHPKLHGRHKAVKPLTGLGQVCDGKALSESPA